MARPPITGNESCPVCGNLGRIRPKTSRGRINGRYIKRSWFRHNDKTIPEHYIDNFTRKKGPIKWTEALSRSVQVYIQLAKLVETLPLKSDERERFCSALEMKMHELNARTTMLGILGMKAKYDRENIPVPNWLQEAHKKITEFGDREERQRRYIDHLIEYHLDSAVEYVYNLRMSDPLYREVSKIYMNYLRPKRLERNEKRNKKLSDLYNYPPRTLPEPIDYLTE